MDYTGYMVRTYYTLQMFYVCNLSSMNESFQVYCDMSELDGGGWILVWQHSYMEDLPLKLSMRYFSEDYTPCVTRASGWCNIPNKARFNPTEQMIVAYHKEVVVYAYKGLFNWKIDHNRNGAILVGHKKIVDECTNGNGTQPAPENQIAIGLTFDKHSPHDHQKNCDTYNKGLQVPVIVDGTTFIYHHIFQKAKNMSK